MIEAEGTATGSLWLGPKYPVIARRGQKKRSLSRFEFGDVPSSADIECRFGASPSSGFTRQTSEVTVQSGATILRWLGK